MQICPVKLQLSGSNSRGSATTLKSKNVRNVSVNTMVMCECGQPKRVVKSRKKVQVKTKFGGFKTTSKIVNSHICLDCPKNILTESDNMSQFPPQFMFIRCLDVYYLFYNCY